MDGMTINHIVSIDHGSCGAKAAVWVMIFFTAKGHTLIFMLTFEIEKLDA
jgi:hypothetical protein